MRKITRKPSQYKEAYLQEQFALWLDSQHILFNASMAGVFLGIPAAVRRKKMGAKKGFPDIQILHARKGYHGLFIEIKSDTGNTKDEFQKEWRDALAKEGYLALIMPPLDFALGLRWLKDTVTEYMGKI